MSKKTLIAVGLIIAAVVVGYLAFHASAPAAPVQQAPASDTRAGDATVSTYPTWYPNGLSLGSGSAGTNVLPVFLGVGVNQWFWTNNTGATQFVVDPTLYLTGTTTGNPAIASSTFAFYVGTTTPTATLSDFARPGSINPIDGAIIATSTGQLATITSTTTTAGIKGIIPVKNGERLFVMFVQTYGCVANALCETATSTNRGFNVKGSVPINGY